MKCTGLYYTLCYLDDFLILEISQLSAKKAIKISISLFSDQGFAIIQKKLIRPTQHLPFLFIDIDMKQQITAQLRRPGIGQNTSCASESLHFETLPS